MITPVFLSSCSGLLTTAGCQHPEHERGIGGADVQELPVQRPLPPGRYAATFLVCPDSN